MARPKKAQEVPVPTSDIFKRTFSNDSGSIQYTLLGSSFVQYINSCKSQDLVQNGLKLDPSTIELKKKLFLKKYRHFLESNPSFHSQETTPSEDSLRSGRSTLEGRAVCIHSILKDDPIRANTELGKALFEGASNYAKQWPQTSRNFPKYSEDYDSLKIKLDEVVANLRS